MRPGPSLAIVLVALVCFGCSDGPPRRSVISSGPDGLRTFTWVDPSTPPACLAFGLVHPVSGLLRGDVDDPQEPVWLEGQAGTRLSVVWPAGFTVAFEPHAVLRDDGGRIVAAAGRSVELSQVDPLKHAGTFGDPYVAAGLLFNGCYPYLP